MADTKIEWCDKVWNPKRLEQPLKWKKPQKIFVNSMSDLFHEDVPFSFVEKVWDIMFDATILHNHIFMILTKRPKRMLEFSKWMNDCRLRRIDYPGVWLGVTIENQEQDWRIKYLLDTPAAVRFVSVEPMLGAIGFNCLPLGGGMFLNALSGKQKCYNEFGGMWDVANDYHKLDWVICGGETGPGARPMHPDWVRSLRDQCVAAGVPFFFKSWGKKAAGALIDGQEWRQFPCGVGRRG
jgi:protein gp37